MNGTNALKSSNIDPLLSPDNAKRDIVQLFTKLVMEPNDHSHIKPPPTKYPFIEDVEEESKSDNDDYKNDDYNTNTHQSNFSSSIDKYAPDVS